MPTSNALSIPAEFRSLPYRWGRFQGWVCLVVGLFAAIFSPIAIASKDERALEYAIVSPLLIASGYAFIRRRRYAVLMTYLWMGLYVVIFLAYLLNGSTNKSLTPYQQGEEIGRGIGTLIVGLGFWGLCYVYYRKRVPEFAAPSEPSKLANSSFGDLLRIDLGGRWYIRIFKVCLALIGAFLLFALVSIVYGFLKGMIGALR